ncbi:hypothetical protein ACQ86G_12465 [Roseateles chitinivorans]|uniref:hypothetical protein n=1 Tax=Roseateles chitinivorans TaxID=2917965 RepID=UPI003D67D2F5
MMGEIGKIAQLASIVIDQRLMAAGTADYLGTQLAERLRLQDKQIPLYILTNHAEDIDTFTGTVEYVLSKGDLATTEKIAAIGARIKRHMDIYSHIQGDREERFELLLRKRFDTSLNSDEEDEFQRLKFSRDREDLTVETPAKDRLLAKLDDAELQLKKIEESLKFRP